MNFNEARYLSKMSLQEIADNLGLSLKTIKHYKEADKAPKAVIYCLMMIGGHIPAIGNRNDFKGWSFGHGFLYSPEGERFTSGDVKAGRYALQEMNRLYRAENRKKQKEKNELSMRVSAQIIQFPVKQNERKYLA